MGGDKSEFIRVMTPDAGGSDKVSTNRGFMAIPEVGDQVMIGFQHNHPDRPFVFGGMFHGKVGAGGGPGNNVRSFSSKSGNIIKLNDGAGIEIKDKAGNHVTLSGTGNLTTEISADYTEKVGGSQTTNITTVNTINIGSKEGGGANSVLKLDNAGNVSITCDTEIKFETGASSLMLKKDGTIEIKGKDIKIEGSSIFEAKAVDSKVIGTAKAEIGGGLVTKVTGSVISVLGSIMTEIKATLIKINS